MAKKLYNKLVRVDVPDFLCNKGAVVRYREVRGEELGDFLLVKALEEVEELIAVARRSDGNNKSRIAEEIVDVRDALSALRTFFGISDRQLDSLRSKKLHRKGAFLKKEHGEWVGVFLESVEEA